MADWLFGSEGHLMLISFSYVVLAIGLLQNAIYIGLLGIAYFAMRRRPLAAGAIRNWQRLNESARPMALLAPAYNEQETIIESVRSLLSLQYPEYEVIVINDGSTDATLERLINTFELVSIVRAYEELVPHSAIRGLYGSDRYPKLLVIDKKNGGKADALNAGINLARAPLFCAIDADSVLEADALLRAVEPFVEDPDRVVAVGGTVRLSNGCRVRAGQVVRVGVPRNPLALLQVVEYLRAFLMARLAWGELGALLIISGAFGIFSRNVAISVGGYSHHTVGEDMEIIVKIHRFMREKTRDYEIRFVPEPICWTEAPETLSGLKRQRTRWQRGTLETFFKHWRMLGNPKYGSVGTIGFVNVLFADVLFPPLEVLGYVLIPTAWAQGILDLDFFLAYLAVTFAFGVFISVGSLALEELELRRFPKWHHLLTLALAAVAENFGYRQLNNFWRVIGWWQFVRGSTQWGEMHRTGFRRG